MSVTPPAFTTPVRGHAFSGRPPTADASGPSGRASILLRREPDNPRDPMAVAVWAVDGAVTWRIGYLERAVAARVARRLDEGIPVAARFGGWMPEPAGRWQRPVVEVAIGRASAPARSATVAA